MQGTLDQLSLCPRESIDAALTIEAYGDCAIHVASHLGAAGVVRRLLGLKPDLATLETTDGQRRTPLHKAASSQNPAGGAECARLLLAHGAEIDATDSPRGNTPLALAAGNPAATATIALLIDAGADINGRPTSSFTPLMHAACECAAHNVAALLRRGARVGAANADGMTAAHCSAWHLHLSPNIAPCLELLLRAGADAAAADRLGRTPLDAALTGEDSAHPHATPLLLGFGSPLPSHGGARAAVIPHLPEAAAVAKRQLDGVAAPEALPAAEAALEARLGAAVAAAAGGGDDDAAVAFARLRVLRSGGLPWEEAWTHAPSEQRTRFSGAVDRLARARALLAFAAAAEPAAAARTVRVLRQLSEAQPGSRECEKLTYAAARCVGKWWDVKQAAAEARSELGAAEAGIAAAREKGEETLAGIRRMMHEAAVGQA